MGQAVSGCKGGIHLRCTAFGRSVSKKTQKRRVSAAKHRYHLQLYCEREGRLPGRVDTRASPKRKEDEPLASFSVRRHHRFWSCCPGRQRARSEIRPGPHRCRWRSRAACSASAQASPDAESAGSPIRRTAPAGRGKYALEDHRVVRSSQSGSISRGRMARREHHCRSHAAEVPISRHAPSR